jgi:Tol biopolymer transport system component
VYDVATGARTVPFASDGLGRTLWALENDGTMLLARGTVRSAVVQRIGLDGRARGRPVRWSGIERRMADSYESVSPDGRLVAYRHGRLGHMHVELARTRDAAHRVVSPYFESMAALGWAPDGRTLVIAGRRRGHWEAWTLAVADRRARRRMTLARRPGNQLLTVAPGATRFAYATSEHRRRPVFNVEVVDLAAGTSGSLQPAAIEDPTLNGPLGLLDAQWSPAGDLIAATRHGTQDIELLDPAGTRRIVVPIDDGIAGTRAWSPDGRVLAYEYQSEARDELHIYDVATGTARVLMSRPRGSISTLIWSPDSHLVGLTLAG